MTRTEELKREITELEKEVTEQQRYYYIDNKPKISDSEFDSLCNKLVSRETEIAHINPWSPTLKVGSDLSSDLPEVTHDKSILSLDKVYDIDALIKWFKKMNTSISIEPKFDGAALVLYYNNGVLDKAVTRGNGTIGNNIIENARTIYNIPLKISHSDPIIIRGEVVMEKDKFKEYNEKYDNKYSNSRNLVAGLLRHKTSAKMSDAPLHFMAYEVSGIDVETYYQGLQFLVNNFFSTPRVSFYSQDVADNVISKRVDKLEKERKTDIFEWDGLVIKINDINIRQNLGETSHHPKWAIAFKFKAMTTVTVLNDITLQVGREGRVTPVAELKPVKLAGSVISRATLHNQDYIDKLGLRIGDTVEISKRGDVIPAVERVIKHANESITYTMSSICPVCSAPVSLIGAHTYCQNINCQSRIDGQLLHFVSKKGLDIKGVGEELIKHLIDSNYVTSIPELYTFDYTKLNGQPGFGDAKVNSIINGLNKSKKKGLEDLLPALGFNMLTHSITNKLIANGYNSIDKILDMTLDDFTRIEGIGDIVAHRILNHLHDDKSLKIIILLHAVGFSFYSEIPVQTSNVLEGQTWCVTGSFNGYKPRSLAEKIIKDRGGKVTSSVTKNTTYLLVGEKAGSKLKKAQELGIKVLDENSFNVFIKKEGAL